MPKIPKYKVENFFAFIVEFDKYSGNFSDRFGNFLVGGGWREKEYIDIFEKEVPQNIKSEIKSIQVSLLGEDDIYSPFSINDDNKNSVSIFFKTKPSDELLEFLKERSYKFPQVLKETLSKILYSDMWHNIKVLGFGEIEVDGVSGRNDW